tara:strand:- start:360 stop:1433 length:1074 start_codon:yes stop_codon:yes gene_type:complete
MSGTSGDGVDASLIISDGKEKFELIHNEYVGYSKDIFEEFHELKEKILIYEDITKYSKKLNELERKITICNSTAVKKIKDKLLKQKNNIKIDFIGFHGQTILHLPEKKTSIQLGDAKLLSQLNKTKVIYNFRENDLKNGGQGAPLAPIFHQLIINKNKIELPSTILNLGGIANITTIDKRNNISSSDIGPGNCLIDNWIRLNSKALIDEGGKIAKSGRINKIILDQSLENFYENPISKKKSYDTNDFHVSFVRGLSLEDGAATLTEFTAEVCSKGIRNHKVYVCGGGRKNSFLLERIKEKSGSIIESIDNLGLDGDFIESQAFAYLAVRSYLDLPISFPKTTGCKKPCSGGMLTKNY